MQNLILYHFLWSFAVQLFFLQQQTAESGRGHDQMVIHSSEHSNSIRKPQMSR